MMRASEPGWIDIGKNDGRRSLWVRLVREEGPYIELCAGREGDDDYVKIEPDNPQFQPLYACLASAVYAAELAADT